MTAVVLGACDVCAAVEQTSVEEFRCRQQSIVEASSAIEAPGFLICHGATFDISIRVFQASPSRT
jgi:hypothetical protein